MNVPSMINGLCLKCNLQATTAHTKMHRVHVDWPWKWLLESWSIHVCIFIFIDRYKNFNFLLPSLSDGSHQTWETRVWVLSLVNSKMWLRVSVTLIKMLFIPHHILHYVRIFNENMIFRPKNDRCGKCSQAQLIEVEKLLKSRPPI